MIDEPAKAVKGHCPNCGPDQLADVVAHHQSQYEYEGEIEYRILRCRGCEAVYFQRDSEDIVVDPKTGEDFLSHTITHWPAPSKRKQPDWAPGLFVVDGDLSSLFNDIYVALNNDLRVLFTALRARVP
jgi:hypothetical protein